MVSCLGLLDTDRVVINNQQWLCFHPDKTRKIFFPVPSSLIPTISLKLELELDASVNPSHPIELTMYGEES